MGTKPIDLPLILPPGQRVIVQIVPPRPNGQIVDVSTNLAVMRLPIINGSIDSVPLDVIHGYEEARISYFSPTGVAMESLNPIPSGWSKHSLSGVAGSNVLGSSSLLGRHPLEPLRVSIGESDASTQTRLISSRRESPVSYSITLAPGPRTLLTLGVPFSSMWKLFPGDVQWWEPPFNPSLNELTHFVSNGYANGWIIPESSEPMHFTAFYLTQSLFLSGLTVATGTAAVLLFLFGLMAATGTAAKPALRLSNFVRRYISRVRNKDTVVTQESVEDQNRKGTS